MEKEYLYASEISETYRVTLVYVRRVIREHKVKAIKRGRDYIVKKSDWEKFFTSKEV